MSLGTTPVSMLDGLRARTLSAWADLYRIYAPLVYGWVGRSGVDGLDQAEITQDVMTVVYHRVVDFRSRDRNGSFRSWLWTITRNEIRRRYRDRQNRPQLVDPQLLDLRDGATIAVMPPTSSQDQLELLARTLEIVRRRVEPRTFQAFEAFAMQNATAEQVAEELDMTAKAVRQAKYRVTCFIQETIEMVNLRDCIQGDGQEPERGDANNG